MFDQLVQLEAAGIGSCAPPRLLPIRDVQCDVRFPRRTRTEEAWTLLQHFGAVGAAGD